MHEAMSASLTPDMLDFLKRKGQKPNIEALKQAVNRLCLAMYQKDAGQRKDSTPDTRVNWQSPEIDLCQFIILTEAVALVLSGKLDELDELDGYKGKQKNE